MAKKKSTRQDVIRKETWYVLGAFAALLALALILQRQKAGDLAAEPTATARPAILELDTAQIVRLEIEDATGARAVLAATEDGQWEYLEPAAPAAQVEQFTVLSGIGSLARLTEQAPLSPLSDLGAVGLEAPAYTLTITLADDRELTLYVGDKTFNGGAYYVRVPDGNPQLANTFTIDALLDLLRTPPILPPLETETPAVTETPAAADTPAATETGAGEATEEATPAAETGEPGETAPPAEATPTP
jgi:hypothetical protein